MTSRILLAVDDSEGALAASRVAIDLADTCHAVLRVVSVVVDGLVAGALAGGEAVEPVRQRQLVAASSVLRYVSETARRRGLTVEVRQLEGRPAQQILHEAQDWSAEVVVLGRSAVRGAGLPYVGSVTAHVLEFAEQPVLVVPPPSRR